MDTPTLLIFLEDISPIQFFQYPLQRRPVLLVSNGGAVSIPKVSIRQIKAARALLAWSQEDLAAAAGVSIPTVKRLEAADGVLGGRADTILKLQNALVRAGVLIIE